VTVIARRIRATPFRASYDAWAVVVDLLSAVDDSMRVHLEDVGDVAAMLIAEEHTENDPIVLRGCGPLVRLYTLHGLAAIDGTDTNEQALQLQASDDWELALPATGTDLTLAIEGVQSADHVTVYDAAEPESSQAPAGASTAPVRRAVVDLSVLEE
jgi:hypothetical protein